MTKNFRMRWIVLAMVWGGIVLLALWNLNTITQAKVARGDWLRGASVRDFLDVRRDEIALQRARIEAQTLLVDSPEIGLLYLERNLGRFAEVYGLQEFRLDGQTETARRGVLPLGVSFVAPVSVAHRWLAALPDEFPYLTVTAIEVRGASDRRVPVVTARLNFKFRTNASASRKR